MAERMGCKVLVVPDQLVQRVGGGGYGTGQHKIGMGVTQLGVECGADIVELDCPFGEQRLFAKTGCHTLQGLVFVLLHGFVQGNQCLNGRQVLRQDVGKGTVWCRKGHH